MPIVFVHGVATRVQEFEPKWTDIEGYLRHYVAPLVAANAGEVAIVPALWGHLASRFRFDGISRPRSALLGMGIEEENQAGVVTAVELAEFLPAPQRQAADELMTVGPSDAGEFLLIRSLTAEQLSDFAAACACRTGGAPPRTEWLVAADETAHDSIVRSRLQRAPDDRTALQLYGDAVEQRLSTGDGSELIDMGAQSGWPEWLRRMTEAADRVARTPGFVASRVLGEARKPVNDLAVRFLGDVFVYLRRRQLDGGAIGQIPEAVLNTLLEAHQRRLTADEPMIVVTHSMGGQIIYDLVTQFLPTALPEPPRIDFWCATASQVGLFLELDLFAAKDSGVVPLPRPSRRWLGGWWNVWDYNDFLSFSARDIVDGVDDEAYSSGLSLIGAHSGYLQRPSFYRRLRAKLDEARARDWDRA